MKIKKILKFQLALYLDRDYEKVAETLNWSLEAKKNNLALGSGRQCKLYICVWGRQLGISGRNVLSIHYRKHF